jgi:hypothetical protein
MNLEIVKKALLEIDDSTDLLSTWFQVNKNLKLKIDDGEESDWDTPEDVEIESFLFVATFYDSEYYFAIDKIDINNNQINIWGLEGDSKLFSSFQETIEEEENLELLKLIALRYEKLEQLSYIQPQE